MTPPTDAERIRKDGERAARRRDPELQAWGERLLWLALAAEIEQHLRERGESDEQTEA